MPMRAHQVAFPRSLADANRTAPSRMTEPFFTTVQFYVDKKVAQLLDPHVIRDKAKAKGLERTSYEYSTYRVPPTKGRITCQRSIAELIAEAFIEIGETHKDSDIRIAAVLAGKAALDALN